MLARGQRVHLGAINTDGTSGWTTWRHGSGDWHGTSDRADGGAQPPVRFTISPRFYARTVFRIRSPLVPSGATGANPSLRNMPEVPNQLHSGTAAIFSETTGKASTIPPPCFLIDSRAACSAVLATPLPRWSRSTKKHVILHKWATRTSGAALRYVRLASIRGSSSCRPY